MERFGAKSLVYGFLFFLLVACVDMYGGITNNKIVSVSLFKNGLGFVTSEVPILEKSEKVFIENLPVPLHGTFWIYPIGGRFSIKQAKAFETEVAEILPALMEQIFCVTVFIGASGVDENSRLDRKP